MNIPEIFKFGNLLSVPLFGIITLFLINHTTNYSIRRHSISQSIKFLTNPHHITLFRLNFLLKSFLDLSFTLYLLDFYKLSLFSQTGILLIFSAILFGSLAYFIEGRYTKLHLSIVYLSGLLWAAGQLTIIQKLDNNVFYFFSLFMIITPIIIALAALMRKKITVPIQIICISMWYLWTTVFFFTCL